MSISMNICQYEYKLATNTTLAYCDL